MIVRVEVGTNALMKPKNWRACFVAAVVVAVVDVEVVADAGAVVFAAPREIQLPFPSAWTQPARRV